VWWNFHHVGEDEDRPFFAAGEAAINRAIADLRGFGFRNPSSDERIRRLEREAAQGDPETVERLARELERAGVRVRKCPDPCTFPATHRDPYGGLDVCDWHFKEFMSEIRRRTQPRPPHWYPGWSQE
jgi:hypothetical protein